MPDTLSEAANAAGLLDPDLLKLARTDVPPREAMAELQGKFPDAFKPQKHARDMTPAEFKAGMREINTAELARNNRAMDETAMARFARKLKMEK